MTKEEARLTLQDNFGYLSQEHPRIIEALRVAIDVLFQPSLPSNLDEAAEEYADYNSRRWHEDGDVYYDYSKIMDAFKAGAEWMTEQGETLEGEVMKDINNKLVVSAKGLSGTETKFGDKVIVQIRKKEE